MIRRIGVIRCAGPALAGSRPRVIPTTRPSAPSDALIRTVLPAWAEVADTFSRVLDDPVAELFPAEAEAIARAVPERQREFAGVRALARAALPGSGTRPSRWCPTPVGRRCGPRASSDR